MTAAFIQPILAAAAAAGTGALVNKFTGQQEQKRPKFQRQLIDQLLQGLQGQGQFSSLFQADQGGFQQGIVDPLQQIFQQQIAPGIQQKFIASGQQRGTPLESALTRSGSDIQSLINQQFLPFQQGTQDRTQQIIQTLLGLGAPGTQASISPFGGAVKGLEKSGAIPDIVEAIAGLFDQQDDQGPAIGTGGASRPAFGIGQASRAGFPGGSR